MFAPLINLSRITPIFYVFYQAYGRCLLKSAHELSSPLPDVVLFSLAIAWQHMVLSEKAGICQFNLVDELKKQVLPSGVDLCLKLKLINHFPTSSIPSIPPSQARWWGLCICTRRDVIRLYELEDENLELIP